MHDAQGRLINCFSAVFPDLSDEEIPGSSVATVEGWDSMASITLLTVVEEEFGFEIEPQEMAELLSFELILAYVRAIEVGS